MRRGIIIAFKCIIFASVVVIHASIDLLIKMPKKREILPIIIIINEDKSWIGWSTERGQINIV